VVSSPNPSSTNFLYAMTVVAPDNIWAAGYYAGCFACVGFSLIVHWNGAAWSVVSVPDVGPSTDSLYGISAISANDIWAAGHYFTGSRWQTLTLHWNGTAWSAVSSPNSTGDNRLYHVEAIASDDVWAVGEAGRTLALHWNGSAWSIAVTPNIGTGANAFYGVDALASNDVWAVGNAGNQTLIERYQDPCASPTSTPTSTSSPTPTPRLLVGHVVWQGPPSQPNARQQLPITLTLKLGSTEVNYPSQNTDATGHFTVPVSSLASGTYNWRVKGPKHLANSGTAIITTS
jgi:hypothetical protein